MDGYNIVLKKFTDEDLMRWACSMIIDSESNMSLERIYRNEHSPILTQLFQISMYGIPTFVSTHFVRHNIGIIGHYCKTQRDDRIGETEGDSPDRWTPTNHGMLCNAQALINIARKRLCYKSHWATIEVMREIKRQVRYVDPLLYPKLVPECIYRGGVCHEDRMCGRRKQIKHWREVIFG
jgi:thymidylate synthase ThyX